MANWSKFSLMAPLASMERLNETADTMMRLLWELLKSAK
jgi:hypothetical protein